MCRVRYVPPFAGARRVAAGASAVMAHENLMEAERARLEGRGGARQVEPPRAVDALPRKRPRLGSVRVETLHPVPAGPRVVQAQPLHVEDLEARALHLG